MKREYGKVKETLFPASLFGIYFGTLLLMSGIHQGLIVLGNSMRWNGWIQTVIPIIYWSMVAMGLTLFTRKKIRETYEKPLHQIAEATQKVADGDFSVYVPAMHTPDRLNYLDVMILDFDKMVEELGSVQTLKTDFVSNVSHEMKTPIAIVKNYAELLKQDNVTEEQRKEYSTSIEEAATKLSDLVTNILKLNKLENQAITPDVRVYDVCRQVCECILVYEDAWEKKQIELDVEMEDTAFVKMDESLLELVWNNLMSNAVKFTDTGGTITVRQTSDEEQVQIAFSDTGCGMNRENMNRIFDKFYQADTSHAREGNGLGLALVKRVLELMDGDIQVVSELGEGSTFTVTLPAYRKREETVAKK